MRQFLILLSLLAAASCGMKGDPIPPGDSEPDAGSEAPMSRQ